MRKSLPSLLSALLFLLAAVLNAETNVGSIVGLSGTVAIDAFGKGSFIPALKGDTLYQGTVIRTGPDGKATLMLQDAPSEVPPAALLKVADLLSARSRRSGLGFLGALGKVLKSFAEAAGRKEGEMVLGSRAAEAGGKGAKDVEWMDEGTEAEAALADAKAMIGKGDWAAALGRLAQAGDPEDDALAAEVLFWRGYCCFQAEDFTDAERNLSDAYRRTGKAPKAETSWKDSRMRKTLLFQLGASSYYIGRDARAAEILQVLLAEGASAEYEPYALLLAVKALASAGDRPGARVLLERARKTLQGSALEKELAAMAAEL